MRSQAPSNTGKLDDLNLENLLKSGHIALKITGLIKASTRNHFSTLDLHLRADASKGDILHEIQAAGMQRIPSFSPLA